MNEHLSNKELKKMYKDYFNKGQVSLLSKLAFSNEKIAHAKGCYISTESGLNIFDMTSGFGTQNLGYNNDEIISVRKEFIESKRAQSTIESSLNDLIFLTASSTIIKESTG